MHAFTFRLLLALVGLVAFIALILITAFLARNGQSIGAFFTGAGATACLTGLYKLLTALGQVQ